MCDGAVGCVDGGTEGLSHQKFWEDRRTAGAWKYLSIAGEWVYVDWYIDGTDWVRR